MSRILVLMALLAQEEARSRRALAELPGEGMLLVAGKAEPWKELPAVLKRHSLSGVRELVLKVDGSVPFSDVQRLMSAAREAGIEGVEFDAGKNAAPLAVSDEARRSLRVKLREGARGLEILLLRESSAVSIDDLRKQLRALEKAPVIVDADFEVPYGAVREVVAACAEEGFGRVTFAGGARKAGALRVLYAADSPVWEYRFLRNMLERAPGIELDVVLASADPDFPGVRREFPRDLSRYDVVLMGGIKDLDEERRKALEAFVTAGGGVVWGTGGVLPAALQSICPVKLSGGTVARRASEAGTWILKDASHPLAGIVDWKNLLADLCLEQEVASVDADARVIVEPAPTPMSEAIRKRENEERKAHGLPPIEREGENPLLVVQAVGKGRTVFVNAMNSHVWRAGTGDRPHFAPFWTGVLQWAAGR